MTRKDVAALLALAAGTTPNIQPTKQTAEAWFFLLGDLDPDVANTALQRVLMRQTIPALPTPGSIRQEAARVTDPGVPDADEAWAEVIRKVRSCGHWGSPEWSHPLVAQAVGTIGWLDICAAEEGGVVRAHFLRVYEAIHRRRRDELTMPERLRLGAPEQRALADGQAR